MIFVEEICEVESVEGSEPRFSATGFAFYPEEKWWQIWK
jgi:hypothetical protein